MKNLQSLEEEIRKALPELMEIKVGLNFIDGLGFKAKIVFVDSRIHYYSESDNELFYDSIDFFQPDRIIGNEIQLIHVLKWLKVMYPTNHDYWAQRFEILKHWNLDKNLLKNQSKELIDFIFNLAGPNFDQ